MPEWVVWNRNFKKFHGRNAGSTGLYVEDPLAPLAEIRRYPNADEAQADADAWNLVVCGFDHAKVQTAEPVNVVGELEWRNGAPRLGKLHEPPPWKGNKWMAERQKRR